MFIFELAFACSEMLCQMMASEFPLGRVYQQSLFKDGTKSLSNHAITPIWCLLLTLCRHRASGLQDMYQGNPMDQWAPVPPFPQPLYQLTRYVSLVCENTGRNARSVVALVASRCTNTQPHFDLIWRTILSYLGSFEAISR